MKLVVGDRKNCGNIPTKIVLHFNTNVDIFFSSCLTKVKVLMFHENVFVPKSSLADITLIGFLTDVCQTNVTNQTIFVSKILSTYSTL